MHVFPPRRRIYLLRHGEVSYIEQGQAVPTADVTLNAQGHAQAAAAAQALAGITFDRAVTSGMPRTIQTAQIVLNDRNLPIESVPDLHEIQGGTIMHLSKAELLDTFVDAITRPLQPEDTFLLGETFGEFRARIVPAWRALLDEPHWRTMLLVLHGAVNRVIMADVLGAELSALGHFEQDAGCINVLDVNPAGYGIIRLCNYTPSNPLKAGMELTAMEQYFLAFPQATASEDEQPAS